MSGGGSGVVGQGVSETRGSTVEGWIDGQTDG